LQPFEKEFFGQRRQRVPILVGGAFFRGNQTKGCLVIDMTTASGQKRAAGLASSASSMLKWSSLTYARDDAGELIASISHEVNQPLAAVSMPRRRALRWLDGAPPTSTSAPCADWVIKEGHRASEVIRRVRALANKTDMEGAA